MKRLALVLALSLGAPSPALAQSAPARNDIDITDLEMPGASVRWGRATGIVDGSPDSVWAVVTDYARYAEFLPHFRASRVLSRRGNAALVYLEAAALRDTVTLWSQMRMRELAPQGETRVIEASMTDGNVERMAARWELTPIDNGTRARVTFQFLIDPSLPVPSSMVTEQNRRSARKALEALRRRVTSLAGSAGGSHT